MECFNDMIRECQLNKMNFKGVKFTWMGVRENCLVKERLDTALMNFRWMELFPNSLGFSLPAIRSDHSSLMIYSNFNDRKFPKRFKFEANWLQVDGFEAMLRACWQHVDQRAGEQKLVLKLKKSRRVLSDWSRKNVRNNRIAIEELKEELRKIQDGGEVEEDILKLRDLKEGIRLAWEKEEMYWFQRARRN